MKKRHLNKHKNEKTIIRSRISKIIPSDSVVFEAFAGSGEMYRSAWSQFRGYTIDKDEVKIRDAARERLHWGVYCGDTKRLLDDGFLSNIAFDVLDFDSYGEPWPFVEAFFKKHTNYKNEFWIIMTDGYWPQRNMANASKTIFGHGDWQAGVSDNQYLKLCDEFMDSICSTFFIKGKHLKKDYCTRNIGFHIYHICRENQKASDLLSIF